MSWNFYSLTVISLSSETPMTTPQKTHIFLNYVIMVGLFLLIAFVLRFIPIAILTADGVSSGVSQEQASAIASALMMQDPFGSVIGAVQGLAWFGVVWFVVRVVERRKFLWADYGLGAGRPCWRRLAWAWPSAS